MITCNELIYSIKNLLHKLSGLIWPLYCPGCNKKDVQICEDCKHIERIENFDKDKYLKKLEPSSLYIYSYYKHPLSSIILAWKNHSRLDFDIFFQNCMKILSFEFVKKTPDEMLKTVNNIVIIPAPSSKKSIKARGKLQTMVLAKGIKTGLNDIFESNNICIKVRIKNILRQKNKTKKQASLNREKRLKAKKGKIRISRFSKPLLEDQKGDLYILVDDVITTGSTIKECSDTLLRNGIHVNAIFALAFTPKVVRDS